MSVVDIKPVDSVQQARRCVKIQRAVWRFSRPDLVSAEMLLSCHEAGGIVLGAHLPEHGLVGFVFSFPAPLGARLIQHSHMLAVLPQFQDRGIGNRLKWAQFDRASRQGCSRITWTYDPLEARNAYLNLNKLGASARRYYTDLYGAETSSELHQGIGTDRLLAEWAVLGGTDASDNAEPAPGETIPQIVNARFRDGAWLPAPPRLGLNDPRLCLEIPASIQLLKRQNLMLAQAWREVTRRAFEHYLPRGYVARRILVEIDPKLQRRRVYYRLDRAAGWGLEERLDSG